MSHSVLGSVIIGSVRLEHVRSSALLLTSLKTKESIKNLDSLIGETQRLRTLFSELSLAPENSDNLKKTLNFCLKGAAELLRTLEELRAAKIQAQPHWKSHLTFWRPRRQNSELIKPLTGRRVNKFLDELLSDAFPAPADVSSDDSASGLKRVWLDYYTQQSSQQHLQSSHLEGFRPRTNSGSLSEGLFASRFDSFTENFHVQPVMVRIPRIHRLPSSSAHGFYGREDERSRLRTLIDDQSCTEIAIVGLGGIGKSALAAACTRDFKEKNPNESIIWLSASTEDELERSLSHTLRPDVVGSGLTQHQNCFQIWKYVFSMPNAGRWLMVLDGMEQEDVLHGPRSLHQYLPSSPGGTIIYTSRSLLAIRQHVQIKNVVRLEGMRTGDAEDLLRAVYPGPEASSNAHESLVKVLQHVPQAILLAGSHMRANHSNIGAYLRMWNASTTNESSTLAPEAVAEGTYLLSLNTMREQDGLAVHLLAFASCIDSDLVSVSIIPKYGPKERISQALDMLHNFSVIERHEDDNSFSVHGLVRLTMRRMLKDEGRLILQSRSACEHIVTLFPKELEASDASTSARALLPHIQSVARTFDSDSAYIPQKNDQALFELAHQSSRNMGLYTTCLQLARTIWRIAGMLHGSRSQIAVATHYDVAVAAILNGQYELAKAELFDLIAIQEELGVHEAQVLSSQHQLGRVHYLLGAHVYAKQQLSAVLERRKTLLGDTDVETMKTANNLALVALAQGRGDDAERLLTKVLNSRIQLLGLGHPDVLTSMNNLGTALHRQRKLDAALNYYTKAMTGRTSVLGPLHPETLKSHANMAAVFRDQSKNLEAESLFSHVLRDYCATLGDRHPDVLTTKFNLASTIHAQKRYEDAVKLYRDVADTRAVVLGENHSDTLAARKQADDLEAWLRRQAKID